MRVASIFDPPDDLAGEPVRMSLVEFKLMEESLSRAQRRHDEISEPAARAFIRANVRRALLMVWPFLGTGRMILPDAHAEVSQLFLDLWPILRRSSMIGGFLPPIPSGLGVIRIQI